MRRTLKFCTAAVVTAASCLLAPAATASEPLGLAFGPCPADLATLHPHLTCATLQVPLDYSRPEGTRINLLVSKAAALNPAKRRGVLLVNPGGPGGSGSEWAGRITKPNVSGITRYPKAVLESYDVIGMDPRGVAHSTPLSCVDPGYFAGPRPDPEAAAVRPKWWEIVDGIAAGCGANEGQLLPHLGTRNVARDLDEVRKALGEQRISYVGSSYGTYLGAVYATMFPDRVDRMILDSSIDPTPAQMDYQGFLAQDVPAETRREQWFGWIARYNDVFGLGATAAEVRAHWDATLEELRKAPRGQVGPNEFISVTFNTMYSESNWIGLATALADFALRGDDAALLDQATPDTSPEGENFTAAFSAVSCVDSAWPKNRRIYELDAARVARFSFAAWTNQWYSAQCNTWPVPSESRVLPDGTGLPPILMFNSEFDSATPLPGARRMHGLLPSSVLVTEKGAGRHGVFGSPLNQQNVQANEIGAAYLVNGVVPASDLDIPAHALPVPTPQHKLAEAPERLPGVLE